MLRRSCTQMLLNGVERFPFLSNNLHQYPFSQNEHWHTPLTHQPPLFFSSSSFLDGVRIRRAHPYDDNRFYRFYLTSNGDSGQFCRLSPSSIVSAFVTLQTILSFQTATKFLINIPSTCSYSDAVAADLQLPRCRTGGSFWHPFPQSSGANSVLSLHDLPSLS